MVYQYSFYPECILLDGVSDSLGLTVNVSGRRVARRVPLQQIVVVLGTVVLAERSVCICQTTKKTQTDAAWYVRVHSVSNENVFGALPGAQERNLRSQHCTHR